MSEPFPDVVRRSWLLFSVLLLLLGMVSWSIWTQNKLVGKIAAMENTLSGKMSSEWEDRLKKLEAQVADSNRWPKDTNETQQFHDEVSELVTGLPAWLEVKYLPRLSVVRWAAIAFNHLYPAQNSDGSLNDLGLAEEIHHWAEVKPDGDVAGLDKKLQDKANEVEKQRIEQAIQWAREYLDGKANTQPGSTDRPDIESIDAFLALHENDPAQDGQNEIKELRKKLESKFHREVEEQQDKARRAYQKWALKEIKKFRGKFLDVADRASQVSEKAQNKGWFSWSRLKEEGRARLRNNFHNKHYEEIHDTMICHLLPVDSALLDLPVLKLYRQAFDNGWALLDGRKEVQDCVAESSAVTPKKSLRAVSNGWVDECKEQNCANQS